MARKNRKAGERKCSRCKNYSKYTAKWHGGVFCPDCLKQIQAEHAASQPPTKPTVKVSGPAKLDLRDEI